jgi:hypothetical protein
MSAQEFAAKINGREYRNEITRDEESDAKLGGLVIVFGASDDLMEFRGAIQDEIGAYGGGTAHLTSGGLLTSECDDENCPYFKKLKKLAVTIKAKWDESGYSWIYETVIPHATFEVLEDGEKYCRGIVFALADIAVPVEIAALKAQEKVGGQEEGK